MDTQSHDACGVTSLDHDHAHTHAKHTFGAFGSVLKAQPIAEYFLGEHAHWEDLSKKHCDDRKLFRRNSTHNM